MNHQRPHKRAKLDQGSNATAELREKRAAFLDSLSRPVSPPLGQSRKEQRESNNQKIALNLQGPEPVEINNSNISFKSSSTNRSRIDATHNDSPTSKIVPSPVQLTKIRDLPASDNVDTVGLSDILGDPLIKEAWIFNFCFDVDWLMEFFDSDVRDLVEVRIVHGSWRREDMNKIAIDDACSRRPNVKAIQAYLPDAFGTHHSKMFVLFRHDDYAQVIIHTANMLAKDWTNMTQAVWRSPLLPLLKATTSSKKEDSGHGIQFKHDLLRYCKNYGSKVKLLTQQLQLYDFSSVKAALVASVPAKFKISVGDDEVWGHEMLRRKVQAVPKTSDTDPHFIFQVSSIASLTSSWLQDTLYHACASTKGSTSIIFPTAPDVARSLDGYAAGGSIHMKAQKPVHLKQVSEIRPQLHRWTSESSSNKAGRDLAAPHIKTYIRFASKPDTNDPTPSIDWALVTSANLSTQAWGSAPKLPKGEKDPREAIVHIQSYEIGVLVWPGLYKDDQVDSKSKPGDSVTSMIPVFRNDMPNKHTTQIATTVGFRMPYDLPLTPYSSDELPWSPHSSYDVPDRHGQLWQ